MPRSLLVLITAIEVLFIASASAGEFPIHVYMVSRVGLK